MSVLIDEINARQKWRHAHTVVSTRRHRLLCVLEGVSLCVLIGMLRRRSIRAICSLLVMPRLPWKFFEFARHVVIVIYPYVILGNEFLILATLSEALITV